MPPVTIENPILNSPYREPARHFRLDANGQITDTIDAGRRGSSYFLPIAAPRRRPRRACSTPPRSGRPRAGTSTKSVNW
jgi:type III restriction enzyme